MGNPAILGVITASASDIVTELVRGCRSSCAGATTHSTNSLLLPCLRKLEGFFLSAVPDEANPANRPRSLR